ncbi:hypothetical protein D3C87_2097160 [compost metagenome]
MQTPLVLAVFTRTEYRVGHVDVQVLVPQVGVSQLLQLPYRRPHLADLESQTTATIAQDAEDVVLTLTVT